MFWKKKKENKSIEAKEIMSYFDFEVDRKSIYDKLDEANIDYEDFDYNLRIGLNELACIYAHGFMGYEQDYILTQYIHLLKIEKEQLYKWDEYIKCNHRYSPLLLSALMKQKGISDSKATMIINDATFGFLKKNKKTIHNPKYFVLVANRNFCFDFTYSYVSGVTFYIFDKIDFEVEREVKHKLFLSLYDIIGECYKKWKPYNSIITSDI